MANANIHFFTEDTDFKLARKMKLRAWIQRVAKNHGFSISDLNYIFCSDDYLLVMNQQYLDHDTYTDVITFDNNPEAGTGRIVGDIFISIDRIRDNAKELGIQPDAELHRVMIHGALHLMGFGDKSASDKLKMTREEDKSLVLLN